MTHDEFRKWLREWQKKSHKSQQLAADWLGVSRLTFSKYLRGTSIPPAKILAKLGIRKRVLFEQIKEQENDPP